MALPTLVGRQKEVVALGAVGHHIVLGTAGSGKTTMAIHRAKYLANPRMTNGGNTLLVTFNRALVTYLKAVGGDELTNVTVCNYHRFALGYLKSRGKKTDHVVLDRRDGLIESARDEVAKGYKPSQFFEKPIKYYDSEIRWIAGHGIATREAYLDADRIGQGSRLGKGLRSAMWDIRDKYLEKRSGSGNLYDWDDIASAVIAEMSHDGNARMYTHIVIDEGQDLSPQMLRSLAMAIPISGSLTFFGDMAQQIYGSRMSWKDAGLKPNEPWRFKQNYRNSKEIAAFAFAIAEMPYYSGVPDMVMPEDSGVRGPKPIICSFPTLEKEVAFIAQHAVANSKTRKVAILLKDRSQESQFSGRIGHAVKLSRDMKNWIDAPGLWYGTFHSAKGLEFDDVFIPFCSSENLPQKDEIDAHGLDEAKSHDGKLLYVAVTRAKSNLVITHCGDISPLIPENKGIYQEMAIK